MFEGFSAEGIFGGIVLLTVLSLLISGTLRLGREVVERDKIIALKDHTIQEQRETIKTLTRQAEVTNHFLQDIREAAYGPGGRINASILPPPREGHEDDS
jgi:hypothetical protein